MQAIENWADVQGTVVSYNPHSALSGFAELEVDVKNVTPVPDYPNLFSEYVGKTVKVNVPISSIDPGGADLSGRNIRLRIKRKGPDAVFAHPEMIEVS